MQTQLFNTAQTQIFDAQAQAAQNRVSSIASTSSGNRAVLREKAEDFEAVFLSQMLRPMFDTVPTDGITGGGQAESVYRGLMVEEMGKSISKAGGIGIADSIYRELIKLQEG